MTSRRRHPLDFGCAAKPELRRRFASLEILIGIVELTRDALTEFPLVPPRDDREDHWTPLWTRFVLCRGRIVRTVW